MRNVAIGMMELKTRAECAQIKYFKFCYHADYVIAMLDVLPLSGFTLL